MSTANNALWGSLVPGGEPDGGGGIDTQEVIDRILPTLHSDSRANLTFWTEADLIYWMDEALKRLSRIACVFVGRDATVLTAPGQATYPLPPQHVRTLHVSINGVSLRPADQVELEAADDAYQTTPGTPTHWYQDRLWSDSIGLAAVPNTQATLAVIYEGWPATLDGGGIQSLVAGPSPLKFYLAMAAISAAYGREGDMAMPDVAAACHQQVTLMDQVFRAYFGVGE